MNFSEISNAIENELWQKDIDARPLWEQRLVWVGRMLYGVARKFVDNKLSMRAMSLVYTTLLSLVPLLAVSFAVLRAFGVHNQLEPTLLELLDPLGDKKHDITQTIVQFVENLRLGVLSSLGVSMLLYTIISMTLKVEQAFNDIWRVSKPRSIGRRFADYLSVILIGPVLVFSGLSLTRSALHSSLVQWLVSIKPFGTLFYGLSQSIPYLIVCAAFIFLYKFIPNTRVRLATATVGGLFAGGLWAAASIGFATLVADSTNYSAIYAGFASVILFMVWLYVAWMIILVGAQLSFYWQHKRFLDPRLERITLTSREREEIALDLLTLIGESYANRHTGLWSQTSLEEHRTDLPPDAVRELLDVLVRHDLIIASGENPPKYLPARDTSTITVREVFRIVHGDNRPITRSEPKVSELMHQIDQAVQQSLDQITIRDLQSNRAIVAMDDSVRAAGRS